MSKKYLVKFEGGKETRMEFLTEPQVGHIINFNSEVYEIRVITHVTNRRATTEEEQIEFDKAQIHGAVIEELDLIIHANRVKGL
jgi:hypothetical protein